MFSDPKNTFIRKNKKLRKVDIFVVNVGLDLGLEASNQKKGCQIRIQRVEKHTKMSFSKKNFFTKKVYTYYTYTIRANKSIYTSFIIEVENVKIL